MTTSGSRPLTPRTSRSAAAISVMAAAILALPSRRDCSSAFLATKGAVPSTAAASRSLHDVLAVEGEHVGEVAVQRGQDLHRGQAAGVEEPVQHHQRPARVTVVDGVGQLVARHVARLAEVRREVLGGTRAPSP